MATQIVRSAFNPVTGKEEVTLICDKLADLPGVETEYSPGSVALIIRINPTLGDDSGVAVVDPLGYWRQLV